MALFEKCVSPKVPSRQYSAVSTTCSKLGLLDSELNTTRFLNFGWIADIDAMALGTVVLELGGGRQELGDDIDRAVGFILEGHVGSLMVVDEPWITVYHPGYR